MSDLTDCLNHSCYHTHPRISSRNLELAVNQVQIYTSQFSQFFVKFHESLIFHLRMPNYARFLGLFLVDHVIELGSSDNIIHFIIYLVL